MSVIGIDPSLTSTAVCWSSSEEPGFKMWQGGTEAAGRKVNNRIRRADLLVSKIEQICVLQEPGAIFIEGYAMATGGPKGKGSPGRVYDLGEFGGMLRQSLLGITENVYEVAPGTLKKFLTGSGKSKKHEIAGYIAKRFGHIFKTDDEGDAFGLWRLGLAFTGRIPDLLKYENECIEIVRKAHE